MCWSCVQAVESGPNMMSRPHSNFVHSKAEKIWTFVVNNSCIPNIYILLALDPWSINGQQCPFPPTMSFSRVYQVKWLEHRAVNLRFPGHWKNIPMAAEKRLPRKNYHGISSTFQWYLSLPEKCSMMTTYNMISLEELFELGIQFF